MNKTRKVFNKKCYSRAGWQNGCGYEAEKDIYNEVLYTKPELKRATTCSRQEYIHIESPLTITNFCISRCNEKETTSLIGYSTYLPR